MRIINCVAIRGHLLILIVSMHTRLTKCMAVFLFLSSFLLCHRLHLAPTSSVSKWVGDGIVLLLLCGLIDVPQLRLFVSSDVDLMLIWCLIKDGVTMSHDKVHKWECWSHIFLSLNQVRPYLEIWLTFLIVSEPVCVLFDWVGSVGFFSSLCSSCKLAGAPSLTASHGLGNVVDCVAAAAFQHLHPASALGFFFFLGVSSFSFIRYDSSSPGWESPAFCTLPCHSCTSLLAWHRLYDSAWIGFLLVVWFQSVLLVWLHVSVLLIQYCYTCACTCDSG